VTKETAYTIDRFISALRITMRAEQVDRNPHMIEDKWDATADHWKCVITRKDESGKRRQMTTFFSMGSGYHGREPEAAEVLDSLAFDAAGYDNAADFEDWADEYGYDPDSRNAERIYKLCGRAARKLAQFLGNDAYDELLWFTERL